MNEDQRRAAEAEQARTYARVTEQLRGSTAPLDRGETMPATPLKQMVQVHNFKDDPDGERDTFFGPFDPATDSAALAEFTAELRNSELADFCSFTVIELLPPSLESARVPWFGAVRHGFTRLAGTGGEAVPMPSYPIAGIEAYLVDDSDGRYI